MVLEVFSNFSDFELLQVMMKLGMGTEPCTSKADLKNLVEAWKGQVWIRDGAPSPIPHLNVDFPQLFTRILHPGQRDVPEL